MIIIPAMDILDGCVVRLTQGDYDQKKVYSHDPIRTAEDFQKAGVKKLHLVDLSGAKYGRPVHAKLFGEIRQKTGISVEAGGGIRTLDDALVLFDNGLEEKSDFIMIGSLPFKNRKEFEKIQNRFASNILLTVDVWDREVKISGWQESTGTDILSFLKEMKESGLSNFLITQIKKDGMLSGPDVELYKEINDTYSDISVTVSGGVSSMEDIQKFPPMENIKGIILGRAFYENRVTLEDLKHLK